MAQRNENERTERNGQYQNQDFWTELNDKHIDEIDFTCTSRWRMNERTSSGDALVPARCDACTLQF